MSSFVRTLERSVPHRKWVVCRFKDERYIERVTVEGRKKPYQGRGRNLGVTNPRDPCRTGKRKTPMK